MCEKRSLASGSSVDLNKQKKYMLLTELFANTLNPKNVH